MAKKIVETPLMKQYAEMKQKHPDALLLFRVGDFYETFSDDAIKASQVLGITLTRRANGKASHVELAGFPHHALDSYLPKLVRAGYRVAICEQLEDPKLAKKLVKRGITELVTPGLSTSDAVLNNSENSFLAAIHFGRHLLGVALLDLSTGEFLCARGEAPYVEKLIATIAPKEIIRMQGTRRQFSETISHRCPTFELEDWVFTRQTAQERLTRHFGTRSLKGFGVEDMEEAVIAAGAILTYLDQTQHTNISHITALSRIEEEKYVRLDRFTVRNLELLEPTSPEGKSLVQIIDKTSSPMGARLLRRWILFPLLDIGQINARLDIVDHLFRDPHERDAISALLARMGDPERLVGKAATLRINPREMNQMLEALRSLCCLRDTLCVSDNALVRQFGERMNPMQELTGLLERSLVPDAPIALNRGGDVIAPGVNQELDELRDLRRHSKEALNDILKREIEATGIPSLKISFNNVFGYYIEVRNTHRERVPASWMRKQTLVSAERYITPELKEYEERIVGAEGRIAVIEAEIFRDLVAQVASYSSKIQADAAIAARLDCLVSFALAARDYNYVRPEVNDSLRLRITEGRHPVIERRLPPGEPYISNSLELDSDSQQIMMITGPNMSGKSAVLRQTALITLMAQIGSYVPAQSASIGVVDKIFTRVGASDNISLGESTFMVEMNESAAILNNMSARSLILFDELGRGTSTYDGISIAWSIVEHIHENGVCRPRTLFATHYHELNEMEKSFKRVANYNVSVDEIKGKVVFLRKLKRGGSAHSFGIYVAKIAGMPPSIIRRAEQVLKQLEAAAPSAADGAAQTPGKANVDLIAGTREGYQLSFFQLDDPLLSEIRDKLLGLDVNNLTPVEALNTLNSLQLLLRGK